MGANKMAPIIKPSRNTFNGPISSILWPIFEAAIIVPRPGVAATIPAIRATFLLPGIIDLTYNETIGSIDIVADCTSIVVMNIATIN